MHKYILPTELLPKIFSLIPICDNWLQNYSVLKHGKSEGFDSCDGPSNLTQIGLKSLIFCPCDLEIWWMTPKNYKGTSSMPHQALCIISDPSVNSNWSYSPETPNLGQIRWFLESCDLEIWWMTLKNNRAPLQCYFKLCASFRSHRWFQTGDTVRERPIWVKIDDF